MSLASIALLALAIQPNQVPETLAPDRPLELVLGANDALLPGHGPSRRLRFDVPAECTLVYVWASSRVLDPFLIVEDGAGKQLASDEDSGGGKSASLRLDVSAGSSLTIQVASHSPAELGALVLAVIVVPRLPAEDAPALQAARARITEAIAATKKKQFDAARSALRAAIDGLLALDAAHGGTCCSEIVGALWDAGNAAAELHAPELCRAAWTPVLAARERRLPDEHPALQDARVNLANTLADLGDLATARSMQEHVLEVYTRTRSAEDAYLLRARANLAATLSELGELDRARDLLVGVLEVQQRTLSDENPSVQRTRVNLAVTLRQLGEYTGARSLLERVVAISERTRPEDDRDLQTARMNLANVLRRLGDHEGARSLEERALQVYERILPADHPDLLRTRISLGLTQQALENYEAARELEEAALETCTRTLPADHPQLQAARVGLARTLVALDQSERGLELLDQVLAVYAPTHAPDHPDVLIVLEAEARARFVLNEFPRARETLERVLAARERTLTNDQTDLALSRYNVAAAIAGQCAAQGSASPADRARFLELARAFTKGLRQSTIEAVLSVPTREAEERVAVQLDWLSRALSLAQGFSVLEHDDVCDELAFLAGESARSVAQSSWRIQRSARREPGYDLARQRLRAAGVELAKRARAGASPSELASSRSESEHAEEELLQLGQRLDPGAARALQADLGAFAAVLGPNDAMVAYRRYMRSTLESGPRVGARGTESLCAFVLRPGSVAADSRPRLTRVELGPMSVVEERAVRWRALIATPIERGLAPGAAEPAHEQAGDALREAVFDPLRPALAGVTRIVVALDDVLHLVPLDALPDVARAAAKERTFLGDSLAIQIRPTLLECLEASSPAPADGTLLAIGNPDLDHDPELPGAETEAAKLLVAVAERPASAAAQLRGGAWERGFIALPGTREEVRTIGQYYDDAFGVRADAHVLERRAASRENLFELASKARFLHVATHGWFAPESIASAQDPGPPMRGGIADIQRTNVEVVSGMSPMLLCGLALAGANLPADVGGRIPGLVTAQELATLDLSGCELAVLSACDTNVGLRRAGQGVASLQKSLHMAGARSVITALWKVPDEATRELMVDFYRRIWVEKKPKSQALWEAKMKLRRAKDENGRARYAMRDWAAWVLTGDPN